MGIGTWVAAAIAAFLLTRLIRRAQLRWPVEATIALAAAMAAGLAATALDFGGWKEPDWRAATFSFLVAFAAIPLSRLLKLVSGLEKQLFTKKKR